MKQMKEKKRQKPERKGLDIIKEEINERTKE